MVPSLKAHTQQEHHLLEDSQGPAGMGQKISHSIPVGIFAHLTNPARIQQLEGVTFRHAVPPSE